MIYHSMPSQGTQSKEISLGTDWRDCPVGSCADLMGATACTQRPPGCTTVKQSNGDINQCVGMDGACVAEGGSC